MSNVHSREEQLVNSFIVLLCTLLFSRLIICLNYFLLLSTALPHEDIAAKVSGIKYKAQVVDPFLLNVISLLCSGTYSKQNLLFRQMSN